VKAADWFTLLTPASVQASVPANGTTPAVFGFRAAQAVEAGPLRITAANAQDGDAVEKTVRVHPDGEPRAVTASRLLRGSSTAMDLDLPAGAMAGSLHAELLLYPNLGAQILHSMKAVLERPYGCGEQTISSTYPSLLYLELLKASKGASPMEDQARTYLQLGYDRLLGYFDPGGGLPIGAKATTTQIRRSPLTESSSSPRPGRSSRSIAAASRRPSSGCSQASRRMAVGSRIMEARMRS